MIFTIYCLGDVKLFASALNGVAMMYKVAEGSTIDMWTSNLPMGLGYGALLGALMALLVMIYSGYQKKQLDFRSVLLPLFLYFALTVPKATIVIQDAYSDQAPVHVDNVPVGLALPLGTISSVAMVATEQIETVFYVPYGGFTKISDEGYVAPLKLLHAIKYTGVSTNVGVPNLRPTLTEISKICLVNNSAFDSKSYNKEIDGFSAFLSALQSAEVSNRYVKVPVSGAVSEKIMSCSDAGDYVSRALDAYMAGKNSGATNQMLSDADLEKANFQKDIQNALNQQNNASSAQGVKYTENGKIVDTIGKIAGANNQEVVQFLKTAMLDGTLSTVNHCTASKLESDKAKCQNYVSAVEQWKEGTAASASGFMSIMMDGQNLLIIFSIVLFPLVLLIVIIKGVSSFKIFGSYILFTICAYMWLPIASIINFYTHLQLHEEFLRFNPTGDPKAFLSLKNAPAFYDAVSTKLTLANGALTSVPMISMGLFSGMLFTIQGLADKWNTQSKYFDAKSSIPDTVKRGPIADVKPSVNFSSINGKAQISGLAQAQNTSKSVNLSESIKQVEGARQQSSKNLSRLLSDTSVKDQSVEWKWAVAEKTAHRIASENSTSAEKKKLTAALYNEMFGGEEGVKNQYANTYDKNETNQVKTERYSKTKVGLKAGTQIGDANPNDPDKKESEKNNEKRNGLVKVAKEAGRRAIVTPDLDMSTGISNQGVYANTEIVGKGEQGNTSLASSSNTNSELKTGIRTSYGNGQQLTDTYSDIIAAELNSAVTSSISSTKKNEATASWQKKYEDYVSSSNERSKAMSYVVSQARSSEESANMLNWAQPSQINSIRANIQASNMLGNPQYEATVQNLIQKMDQAGMGLMSEENKLLLAQHTALKVMGSEQEYNAVKAELGHFEMKVLQENFMPERNIASQVDAVHKKQQVEETVKQIQGMDFEVDIADGKQQAIDRYNHLGGQAEQTVQAYSITPTSIAKASKEHEDRTREFDRNEKLAMGDEILSVNSNADRLPTQAEMMGTSMEYGRNVLFGKIDKNFTEASDDWDKGNVFSATGKWILGGVQMGGAGILNAGTYITPDEIGATVKHADGTTYQVSAVEKREILKKEAEKFGEQMANRKDYLESREDELIKKSQRIPDK